MIVIYESWYSPELQTDHHFFQNISITFLTCWKRFTVVKTKFLVFRSHIFLNCVTHVNKVFNVKLWKIMVLISCCFCFVWNIQRLFISQKWRKQKYIIIRIKYLFISFQTICSRQSFRLKLECISLKSRFILIKYGIDH